MEIIEKLYKLKKDTLKNIHSFYRDYFTIDGIYTSLLPDKIYIKKLYKAKTGKKLNLKNPTLFNEKLNWLKLYNRRPEYTVMADKYLARGFIAEKIGEEYLVPLLAVYDNADEIDFDALPNQFVLKCNHDSEVVICKDKKNNDFQSKKQRLSNTDEVRAYLKKRLNINYYKSAREWPYKNIPRKIVCEKYLSEEHSDTLTDYKFHCFNGKPEFIYVVTEKKHTKHLDFFDMNYNHLQIAHSLLSNSSEETVFSIPQEFEKMKTLVSILSYGIPYCRVDLYNISGKIYFSEITFFPSGGFATFSPEKWNEIFGDYLELPKKKHRKR